MSGDKDGKYMVRNVETEIKQVLSTVDNTTFGMLISLRY